jgi:ATP-binding cassette subfamily B protein
VLARALITRPAILLLDEATSALDARTESELRRSLAVAGEGRTVVSISHRLASVVDADRIFVLAAGRLVEEGTHEELFAVRGLYRQLWDEQHGAAQVEPLVGRPGGAGPDPARALAEVPLLAQVPPDALRDLARAATQEVYGPGTEVGAPDLPMGRLLVVLEGELELIDEDGDGPSAVRRFAPGDFLGELALVREQSFAATLRAVTPVRLLSLARPDFLAVAQGHPDLQRAVLRHLARRRSALASAASASGVHERGVLSP